MNWKRRKEIVQNLVRAWNEELAPRVKESKRKSFRARIFLFNAVCDRGEALERKEQLEEAKYAIGLSDEIVYSILKFIRDTFKDLEG